LRIEPEYDNGVFWVKDASRAVGVARQLISAESRAELQKKTAAEYRKLRERRARGSKRTPPVSLISARENRLQIEWNQPDVAQPAQSGVHVLEDYPLSRLAEYIDWTPFFQTWELAGRFPAILKDPVVGAVASNLYHDAREMLARIIDENWLKARAVYGIFPAGSDGDDVLLFDNESRNSAQETLHFLRQQRAKARGRYNRCFADYIAPVESRMNDHIGLFAVTTGLGIETKLAEFEANNDDYQSILLKALTDRLAEAFAEHLHHRVRTEFWAYDANESLDNESLIKESYRGIRPAPGYPACPDHSEKKKIFALLEAEDKAKMELTSGYAMLPASSVCGYYFAHPQAEYFVLGPILADQLEDYANRKACSLDEARRLLPANFED
jgi:5-methyltetrahydrofolate--homocysteine methyltransferase